MIFVMSMVPPTPPEPRVPEWLRRLNTLGQNYDRANRARVEDMAKYGGETGGFGSRTADLLVRSNAVSDSPGLRAGALAGDILLDPSWLIPGVGAAKAGSQVAKTAGTVAKMSPENRALYGAMLRGLYHGDRTTGANLAKPFSAINRSSEDWSRNWFGGDMFGTTSRRLGDEYAGSATNRLVDDSGNLIPGLTAKGFPIVRGATFRLFEPAADVAQRKILDLTGRTLDEADPVLYNKLVDMYSRSQPLDVLEPEDMAKMMLNDFGLHQSRFSQFVRPILEESGYDTIRHLSGQLQGDIVAPVYAFLKPQGIRATPTLPNLTRTADFLEAGLSNAAQRGAAANAALGASIREGGASALDSLASVLRREDMSQLPPAIRNFVKNRTTIRGAGEGFEGIRSYSPNPQLSAFLRRLGLDRLWPSRVVDDVDEVL